MAVGAWGHQQEVLRPGTGGQRHGRPRVGVGMPKGAWGHQREVQGLGTRGQRLKAAQRR